MGGEQPVTTRAARRRLLGPTSGAHPGDGTIGEVNDSSSNASFYDLMGGEEAFTILTKTFYREVANDDVLYPLYPADDMDGAERRLRMFLEQYWGGPKTYQAERGHPRLRMRHHPFKIGPLERDAWIRCMMIALDEVEGLMAPADFNRLRTYLVNTAHALMNSPM